MGENYSVNPTEKTSAPLCFITDERVLEGIEKLVGRDQVIVMPQDLYQLFCSLYKICLVGLNITLIKDQQILELRGHQVKYELYGIFFLDGVQITFKPMRQRNTLDLLRWSIRQPQHLTCRSLEEARLALITLAQVKYDSDNNTAVAEAEGAIPNDFKDISQYRLAVDIPVFLQLVNQLPNDVQYYYAYAQQLLLFPATHTGQYNLRMEFSFTHCSYRIIDHHISGCSLERLREAVAARGFTDPRRPDFFVQGFILGDEPDLPLEQNVQVIDIDLEENPANASGLWE